mmetsp:Transcript_1288/g.3305  ORF Transcript_1288/g.3305 Transcript_1288/m.3305 type:complete len:159 (+) Transcript_1288:3-479(+)
MLFMLPLSACHMRLSALATAPTMFRGVSAPHSRGCAGTRMATNEDAPGAFKLPDALKDIKMPDALKDLKMTSDEQATTAAVYLAGLVLVFAAAPELIDNGLAALAFPIIALTAGGAAPLLETQLESRGIISKPLTDSSKSLITTTTTVLCLKLMSLIF